MATRTSATSATHLLGPAPSPSPSTRPHLPNHALISLPRWRGDKWAFNDDTICTDRIVFAGPKNKAQNPSGRRGLVEGSDNPYDFTIVVDPDFCGYPGMKQFNNYVLNLPYQEDTEVARTTDPHALAPGVHPPPSHRAPSSLPRSPPSRPSRGPLLLLPDRPSHKLPGPISNIDLSLSF